MSQLGCRRYFQLPVSGRRMQHFLQLRLDYYNLPVGFGCFAESQHVARSSRVCMHCGGVADAHGMHMDLECLALHTLRKQYAPFWSTNTDTSRSCFAQQDRMHVFNFVVLPLFFPEFDLCFLLYVISWQIRSLAWLHLSAVAVCQACGHPTSSTTSSLASTIPYDDVQRAFSIGQVPQS